MIFFLFFQIRVGAHERANPNSKKRKLRCGAVFPREAAWAALPWAGMLLPFQGAGGPPECRRTRSDWLALGEPWSGFRHAVCPGSSDRLSSAEAFGIVHACGRHSFLVCIGAIRSGPKVAAARQPWAGGRNPFGICQQRTIVIYHVKLQRPHRVQSSMQVRRNPGLEDVIPLGYLEVHGWRWPGVRHNGSLCRTSLPLIRQVRSVFGCEKELVLTPITNSLACDEWQRAHRG
jgi:hypothetical protein